MAESVDAVEAEKWCKFLEEATDIRPFMTEVFSYLLLRPVEEPDPVPDVVIEPVRRL